MENDEQMIGEAPLIEQAPPSAAPEQAAPADAVPVVSTSEWPKDARATYFAHNDQTYKAVTFKGITLVRSAGGEPITDERVRQQLRYRLKMCWGVPKGIDQNAPVKFE